MDLIILRCVFLLCAGGVSAIINASLNAENSNEAMPWVVFTGVMSLALVVVIGDIYARVNELTQSHRFTSGFWLVFFLHMCSQLRWRHCCNRRSTSLL